MPKSVVVVGGSMSGLMHGLQLKRQGHRVTILELDPASDRNNHQAGMRVLENVHEFMRKYDDTGLPISIPARFTHIAYYTRQDALNLMTPRDMSSWGLLYRILRANFDGLVSAACSKPPAPRKGDGPAEYLTGKRVTQLQYQNGVVTVQFVDVSSGEHESLTADLVIGADGVHSTVRTLVRAPSSKEYAGYVTWRGITPEKCVSKATAQYFADRTIVQMMKRSYMICYVIPTDDGRLEPGERLINWAWYFNVGDGSPEMTKIFTDIHGNRHQNTVPQGLVQPEIWQRLLADMMSQMAGPVAELVFSTRSPFVTKINDALCDSACFYDGHVVLVGDAFATIRPHIAMATEQAARHCNLMDKVLHSEKSLEDWSREVIVYGKRHWLLSRVVGEFGQGTHYSFLKATLAYIAFMIRWKFLRWSV